MQDENTKSMDLIIQEGLLAAGSKVRLEWRDDGTVHLVRVENSNAGPAGSEIFAVSVSQIKRCLIADGEMGIYLWIDGKKYVLNGGAWGVMAERREQQGPLTAYGLADGVISGTAQVASHHDNVNDFLEYLRSYGVKTQKSSLIKIILVTTVIFIAAVVLLFVYLFSTYSPANS